MTGSTTKVENYLDQLFPKPKCELNYTKDYELLLATMLSAQTTDKRVNMVTADLFKKYPSLKKLALANINDIIKIIKPLGSFNKKSKNIIEISKNLVAECDSKVPNNRTYLEKLPGVGRKTANVVLSNLFDEPCIAVDTHVSRVSIRLGFAKEGDSPLAIEQKLIKIFKEEDLCKRHHQMVLFGRYHCRARNPKCQICKINGLCKYYKNTN